MSQTLSQASAASTKDYDNTQIVIDIADVFPADYNGGTEFEVPNYSFLPDQWTRAFLRGLAQFDGFDGKTVVELGIGTGVNAAYVLQSRNPKCVVGSDIDGMCTIISLKNVYTNVDEEKQGRFRALAGDQNLASWIHEKGFADVVFGCLPQVIKSEQIHLHEGNDVSHYYDPAFYPSELHHLGLGLNDFALRQLHPLLNQGASVILNLSGRPGLGKGLEELLFRTNGYEPRVLHEEVVAQHAGTSVATLAEVEKHHGHEFEFFTSIDGAPESKISATFAEERRLAGLPVFHKIYVIEGKKI